MGAKLLLFLTEEAYSHGGLRARELGQTPLCFMLAWVTIVLTSPDLNIEFSTGSTRLVYEATNSEQPD